MTELTRRRAPHDTHRETWHIYFGDVMVGTIGERAGVPKSEDQWGWTSVIFGIMDGPRSKHGTAATFEECRAGFQKAWDEMRPKYTEAHFESWRCQRDFVAWKYRMHDTGAMMPTQVTTGRSRCFCGTEITIATADTHVRTAHRGIGE